MKILVTAGAAREPIDAVRFLSNVSTGATGAALADEFVRCGHTVLLLRGEGAVASLRASESEVFSSAADLRARLEHRLGQGGFDAVVMAAAVADFRPASAQRGKISSDVDALTIQLVRNEKILPRLKSFTSHPLRVVGFKLTVGSDALGRQTAVAKQFSSGGVDAVVQNDLAEIRVATVHPFWLWRSADAAPVRVEGVPALAVAVLEILSAPSP